MEISRCTYVRVAEGPLKINPRRRVAMDQYGIFKGLPDMMPFQLGLTPDLPRAFDLMNRMNERIPGHYFIRNMITKMVVASVHSGWSGSPDNPEAPVEKAQKEPTFDIFCGVPDKNATWYEAVEGLANARERMEQIARIRPGSYFVFSRQDHSILARTETICKAARMPLAQTQQKGKLAG